VLAQAEGMMQESEELEEPITLQIDNGNVDPSPQEQLGEEEEEFVLPPKVDSSSDEDSTDDEEEVEVTEERHGDGVLTQGTALVVDSLLCFKEQPFEQCEQQVQTYHEVLQLTPLEEFDSSHERMQEQIDAHHQLVRSQREQEEQNQLEAAQAMLSQVQQPEHQ